MGWIRTRLQDVAALDFAEPRNRIKPNFLRGGESGGNEDGLSDHQ